MKLKTKKAMIDSSVKIILLFIGALILIGLSIMIITLITNNTNYQACKTQIALSAKGVPVGFSTCHEYILKFGEKEAVKYDLLSDKKEKIFTYSYSKEIQKLKNEHIYFPEEKEREYAVYSIILQEMKLCDNIYYVDSMLISRAVVNFKGDVNEITMKLMKQTAISSPADVYSVDVIKEIINGKSIMGAGTEKLVNLSGIEPSNMIMAKPCVSFNFDSKVFLNTELTELYNFASILKTKDTDDMFYADYFRKKYLAPFAPDKKIDDSVFLDNYNLMVERYMERIKTISEQNVAAFNFKNNLKQMVIGENRDNKIDTTIQYNINVEYLVAETSTLAGNIINMNLLVAIPYNLQILRPETEIAKFQGLYLPMG